jgi:hypothetical protein
MGTAGVMILVVVILAVAILVWGAVTRKRSFAVALVALAVAGLAALLSYYALVESQSVAWALGYGVAAVLSAAVAGRHLVGRLLKSDVGYTRKPG